MTWRGLVLATATFYAGALPVVDASAHNGVGAAFKGKAGRYIVYAYDGELLPSGRLDYKLVLLNAKTQNPVYDAHPVVTARRAGDRTTASITAFGNVFFYNLPNPYPHDWDVHLRISGPLGVGAVDYRMHGASPADATPRASSQPIVTEVPSSRTWPWIVAGAGGVLALAGVGYDVVRRRGRRRRSSLR